VFKHKKKDRMKNKILFTAIIINAFTAFSQSETTGLYTEKIDSILQTFNLKASDIPTGILYDRALPISGLPGFQQSDTVCRKFFLQAAHELWTAAYVKPGKNATTQHLRNIADRYQYRDHLTPIGILFSEFTYIDKTIELGDADKKENHDFQQYGKTLKEEDLLHKKILLSSVLSDKVELGQEVNFIIPDELIVGNRTDKINSIAIDFDDGNGFRDIKPSDVIKIVYDKEGEKVIKVSASSMQGQNYESSSTILIKNLNNQDFGKYGQVLEQYRKIPIESFIPYTSSDGFTFNGRAELTYLLRNGVSLQNPILIVNGFDPEDKLDDQRLFSFYLNNDSVEGGKYKFADKLYDLGYDIVIMNFQQWWSDHMNKMIHVDYIQRNAMVVIAAINTLNQQLTNNNSNNELVVVGASMGGLATRYALTYMEYHNMNHKTKLWVSFDSPHIGANIPIGIQHFIRHFADNIGNQTAVGTKEKSLDNPAARQMLLDYYSVSSQYPSPHALRAALVNDLQFLGGFPQQTRNIAIANGSLNSTAINSPASDALSLRIRLNALQLGTYTIGDVDIRTAPSYSQIGKVFDTDILNPPWYFYTIPSFWPMLVIWQIFTDFADESNVAQGLHNSFSMDNSPGGTRNTFKEIKDLVGNSTSMNGIPLLLNWNLHFEDHPFIHTKSALAFQGSNQDLSESLTRSLVYTQETPFDSYWAPLNKNMGHVTLFDEELMDWLLDEINGIETYPCPTILFANRSVITPITLDHCHTIVRDVSTKRNPLMPVSITINSQKVDLEDNVIVGEGTKLHINAENVQIVKNFEARLGSELIIQ
jgi:hypothetical protein